MVHVEICINCNTNQNVRNSVTAAFDGGADTVELCSAMDVEGLTPSLEHIEIARSCFHKPGLMVMIRPRDGDFTYSKVELDIMIRQIKMAADAGANGVVFGGVRAGKLEREQLSRLSDTCNTYNLRTTLHRAFDTLTDPQAGLETLIDAGVDRVLTSGTPWGSHGTALEGIENLYQIIQQAKGRIEIVIGGGIKPRNVNSILRNLSPYEGNLSIHAYSSVLGNGVAKTDLVQAIVSEVHQVK